MKTKLKCLVGVLLLVLVFCVLCACGCQHQWQDATCAAPASCHLCGETKGEALGHAYSESVTVQPTCGQEGTKLYTCTVCDDSYTETVNALEHTVANGLCTSCGQLIKGGSVLQGKSPICTYTTDCPDEGGTEALYIYLPTGEGYIRYQMLHTVVEAINANTWRLGYVSHVDDNLKNERMITLPGSEWEMAVQLKGRVDFIGGFAHGDEICSSMKLVVDGESYTADEMISVPFDTLTVEVRSTGYDPNAQTREVLSHYKKLTFTEDGVRVEQTVRFLTDEIPTVVYLGMLPPCKEYTDHFYTNVNPELQEIPAKKGIFMQGKDADLTSVTLVGEDGYLFRMTAEKYNVGENSYIISDNSGNNYNKLYFPFSTGPVVNAGDRWTTVTFYEIQYK